MAHPKVHPQNTHVNAVLQGKQKMQVTSALARVLRSFIFSLAHGKSGQIVAHMAQVSSLSNSEMRSWHPQDKNHASPSVKHVRHS